MASSESRSHEDDSGSAVASSADLSNHKVEAMVKMAGMIFMVASIQWLPVERDQARVPEKTEQKATGILCMARVRMFRGRLEHRREP